ncbi:MAG: sigma-70 family RNA polymerase sigma factor [Deltaproteobacteria bacterium]|nr:sigma-70 family RNA polymerase sigma factor [Deltaproteobacteria bacterium]
MLGSARSLRQEFEREALPHLSALYGTALRLTHDPREAEDLVQDAMLRAFRFFHRFERGTNAKAWLFKILHNTFINRYRRRLREQRLLNELDRADHYHLVAGDPAPAGGDPERALSFRLLEGDVQRALAEVPPDFRMAVILADLEEFSYKEIAEIMDCPVGTVMSRLYRGRRILQRLLHDHAVAAGIVKPAGEAAAGAPPPAAPGGAVYRLSDYRAGNPRDGDG